MKVTVAHMGRFADMMKPFLEDLGLEPVMAPRPGRATLERGISLSPEFACLPLKLNIGTFMDAGDAGADTILMAGGLGPCRFGYYAEIQKPALAKAGYDLRMVTLEPPKGRFMELAATIRQLIPGVSVMRILKAYNLALARIAACDDLEAKALSMAWRDTKPGTTMRALDRGIRMVCGTRSHAELGSVVRDTAAMMDSIERSPEAPHPVVGVVGEIYCLLEPFVNMDLYRRLTALGVEVVPTVTLSQWARENLSLNPVRRARRRNLLLRGAKGYLHHWVGGEGLETVSNSVRLGSPASDRRVHGIIQVSPFTCMPEIVGESIMPLVSRDLGLPYMSIVIDEHSSETGLETRLEAFTDLLSMRTAASPLQDIRVSAMNA